MQRAADSSPYDCQICLSIPDGSVLQCRNGHLFCDECYESHRESGLESADQCPTCRVALGDDEPIRALVVEHQIAAMTTQCPHCATAMTRGELETHMPTCPKEPVKCSEEACVVCVPRCELEAHKRVCPHVICSARLTEMSDEFRALSAAGLSNIRREYQGALVSQHVVTNYRECQRHPPGPGFRVELVKPAAPWQRSPYSAQLPRECPHEKNKDLAGCHHRLLCLVPGVVGTDWEGACIPAWVTYHDPLQPPSVHFPANEGPNSEPRTIESEQPLGSGNRRRDTIGFLHANVYPSGKVSVSTLNPDPVCSAWHPSMTLAEVLLSVQLLLDNPNFNDPSQAGPYHLGKRDRGLYDQGVRDQAARYTAEHFDSLARASCYPRPAPWTDARWTDDGQHRIIEGIGG